MGPQWYARLPQIVRRRIDAGVRLIAAIAGGAMTAIGGLAVLDPRDPYSNLELFGGLYAALVGVGLVMAALATPQTAPYWWETGEHEQIARSEDDNHAH